MKKALVFAALYAVLICSALTAQAKSVTGIVNVNTATAAQLMLLPGIGEAKAQAIVAQRQAKPFAKKEELLLIKGIGDKLFAQIAPHVAVQGASDIKEGQ